MIPCIQTLGYLDQIFQWPAYTDLQDVPGVLLVEDERVYALLEKLIAAASTPFRSRRISIGMDETFGLGTGKYKQLHGEKNPLEILNDYVVKVTALCEAQGLRPMMWSDMYFCFSSQKNDYYDRESTHIPPATSQRSPRWTLTCYVSTRHLSKAFGSPTSVSLHRAG